MRRFVSSSLSPLLSPPAAQSVRLPAAAFAGVLLLLSANHARAADDEEKRTPAQAASAKGLKLLESVRFDFDADGRSETVGACEDNRSIVLCVFGENERGAVFKEKSKSSGGNKLKSLKVEKLVPEVGNPFIALEVYGENPDEKTKRIRIYTLRGGLRQVFTSVIFRPKTKDERAEWERDDDVVKYGDPRAGWYFADLDGDGKMEILVRRKPQIVALKREDRAPKRVITGVREAIYDWTGSPTKGSFKPRDKERLNNFIPPRKIVAVRASSAYIPRKIEKKMQQDATAKAAMAAANGEEKIPSKEIDRSAYIVVGADDNLETSWIEDDKGNGEGEWIEVELDAKEDIRMIRVVAGCTASKKIFRSHNVPVKFELKFGPTRALVDREIPQRPIPPILGIIELPVRGKKFAKQTLVFFDGRVAADVVRLTLQDSRRLGRANRTCISEISIH